MVALVILVVTMPVYWAFPSAPETRQPAYADAQHPEFWAAVVTVSVEAATVPRAATEMP